MLFLGIDIGTSGVKTTICDAESNILASTHVALDVQRPNPLWSEQSPKDWWSATHAAVLELDPTLRSGVKAIGLSGQMHGATLLGANDNILRPGILWNDGRSMAQCVALETRVTNLHQITGNCAMPGFTAPKLLWVQENEPEIFSQTRKILLPKDYVRLCMIGDYATDMSDAAGTLWLNTAERNWSDEILEGCDLNTDHMPTLFEGTDVTGTLRADIANKWNMPRVPVAAGGGDNAAGAVGSGVFKHGDALLSLGASGVIFLADDAYRPHPIVGIHTFCHALPEQWHQMSVMLSASSAIDWVASTCGFKSPGQLYSCAEKRNKPAEQEIFLPYLSGERTPHNNPMAQGVFFGLGHSTTRDDMAQAALEGVAFGLADGITALHGSGAEIRSLSVIGGGSRSTYWGEILASVFDLPIIYREGGSVGPALGAARLARLCLTNEAVEDVCTAPDITEVVEPNPELADHYKSRHDIFKNIYTRLTDLFEVNQP